MATSTRIPNNIYIIDKEERKRIKVTQHISKDYNKERKDKKTEKDGEILLSAMSSRGESLKRRVTFSIDFKGGEKYQEYDDSGSMIVSINDKGGYCLMVLSLMSKSIISNQHKEAYGFT